MINALGINEIYESAGGMYLGEGDYSSFRQLLGGGIWLFFDSQPVRR